MRLARPRRCLQWREAILANLEHRYRIRHASKTIATVGPPAQHTELLAELALGAMGEDVGDIRKQDLPGQSQVHQARGYRLDQALDLNRLGAVGNVLAAVVPDHDVADMNANASREAGFLCCVELAQTALIIKREGNRLHRALEHHQETVGLVDLAAAVAINQGARQAIMLANQFGRFAITKALDQGGRINQIAEHQRPQHRAGTGLR